ncbi:hypothetical protein CBS101457_000956 [Exobasidium rhododendri]|nr:hypothetical protein CBS101457_000956 [Exobasidium rhododendri]
MTTSSSSAPIRDLADSTSDPIASSDTFEGISDRFGHSTALNFARPEKSPARRSMDGAHATNNGGTTGLASVGNAASSAYERAPDLGISSTAKSVYQRAPDLGVGATISNILGTSETSQVGETAEAEEDYEKIIRSPDNGKQTSGPSKGEDVVYDRREESLQKGPSSQDRVGKSQQEIGTETGIPTQAGTGQTVSPDETNRKALEKAKSEGKTRHANVPEDYEATFCPTENAGTGKSKGVNESTHPSRHPSSPKHSNSKPSSPKVSGHHSRKSSSQARDEHRKVANIASSDGSPIEMENRRSFGEKLMDQVKGEMKILAGTVTGKDDKVIQGLAIKHGDGHS